MPRPPLAILRAQQAAAAPTAIQADTAGAAVVITLTPAMRRMILEYAAGGDGMRPLLTRETKPTYLALKKRGLLVDGKPTPAAIAAARA